MQVLQVALVLFTSCSFIQKVSFQLWGGVVTAFTFMASYVVMMVFFVCVFFFWGGGVMGEKKCCENP